MTTPKEHTITTNGARAPADEWPRTVTEALSRVMAELPSIGKDERADPRQGGYAYRGIEQITRAVQPLFARYGIVLVPHVQAHEVAGVDVGGKAWSDTRLLVSYTVYGPGGAEDKIEAGPFLGIGRDGADKGANKAMTQVMKYLLLQLLCISDAKDDGDAGSIEADHPRDAARREPQPWWQVYGYPDLDHAQEQVAALNAAMRQVPTGRRGALRDWLKARGYPASLPVTVRAEHVAALEELLAQALAPQESGAPLEAVAS